MSGAEIVIAYLADHPEHLKAVATWVHGQWGHLPPSRTVETIETKFATHLQRDAIPLTMLALEGGHLLGTASLVWQDMSIRPDLSPWLASVYVDPAYRNRGIGSRMVQAIEERARALRIAHLYLFTPDRQSFYARLGWAPLGLATYRGETVTIMSRIP